MRTPPIDKVMGYFSGRYKYNKPATGFVFDNSKLCFTSISNFEGEDRIDLWMSDKVISDPYSPTK